MARVSIDVDNKLLHTLKIHTACTKSSIKDFVTKAILSQIEYEKQPTISKNIPNIETMNVFKNTDGSNDLNEYSSWERMVSKIEQESE